MRNKKSDVPAKLAYKKHLEKKGFKNVRIVANPTDIIAEKNGENFYFEIKMTKQKNNYFGAATMTEREEALKNPNNFKFVVVKSNNEDTIFDFLEFSPEEFLKYSTIPPFKVYFNIDLNDLRKHPKREKALQATNDILNSLIIFFEKIKNK